MLKRAFDMFFSMLGLVLLSPLLLLIALIVRLDSAGPVIFRQKRVGRFGRDFYLCKFRTMKEKRGAAEGSFTPGDISRVTASGKLLRLVKLDELPQLWNVVKGDMSLVGPRPEVRKWVEVCPDRWQNILKVRPGITDPASIVFRNEEELLSQASNPEKVYRDIILPRKLELYEKYIEKRDLWNDLKIIFQTFKVLVFKQQSIKPLDDKVV